jgi:hypothetical protein
MTFDTEQVSAEYRLIGNSKDCDCNLDTFECFQEGTTTGNTGVVAVARYTLTPTNESAPVEVEEKETVTDTIVVGGGGSKSEVRWRLVCDDNEIVGELVGRSPYSQNITIPVCSSCTVFMKDTYGDGWQRGTWVGFGQTYTGPTNA